MMRRQSQVDYLALAAPDWTDYELLDSGAGAKLERFGPYCVVRPEAQATWRPALPRKEWQAAHAVFQSADGQEGGSWLFRVPLEARWSMQYKHLRFWVQPTPYRHMGVFPEQANHWDWMSALIEAAQRPINVLNLFGYTGIATLAAAAAGARVTHVDASKKTVAWARDNQALSALEDRPIRWIVDDALKFAQREARRGVRYDGFMLDPPPFGRGPKGEVWRLKDSLPALLEACRGLLSETPLFVVTTAYATKVPAQFLRNALAEILSGYGGSMAMGEMVLVERSAGRSLSTAIFARWAAN